jgi:U3 small nucleolar RNA-associated protein 12
VTCIEVSPTGRYVACGYADGMIRLYDPTKGATSAPAASSSSNPALVMALNGHGKAVTCLSFSPDGTQLASGAKDTDAIVWDLVAEAGVCRLRGHRDEITDLLFLDAPAPGGGAASSDGPRAGGLRTYLVTSSKDATLKVWDLVGRRCVQTVLGTRSEVWSMTRVGGGGGGDDELRILAGAGDNLLRVWSVGSRAAGAPTSASSDSAAAGPASALSAVAASLGGGASASSTAPSSDFDVLIPMGTIPRQTHERASLVRSTPDGRFVAVQSAGKTVEVFRRRTPGEVAKRILRRLRRAREKLAKKQGAAKALLDEDDKDNDEEEGGDDDEGEEDEEEFGAGFAGTSLADLDAHIRRLEAEAVAAASAAAALSSQQGADGVARPSPALAAVTARDEWELVGVGASPHKLSSFAFLRPDGEVGAGASSASSSSGVRASGPSTLPFLVALHTNALEVHALPLTPASSKALGAKMVTTAAGLTVPQAVLSRSLSLQGHRGDIRAVAVSSDGALLLSTSAGTGKVWNAKTGVALRTLEFPGAETVGLCAAFCPGNRHAVIGCKDGRLFLFDLSSADLLEEHAAHAGAIWSLAVRPDGKGLCTGSADKEVKFWDFDLTTAGAAAAAAAAAAAGAKKGKTESGAAAAPAPAGLQVLTVVHVRTLKLTDEVLCVKYSRHTEADHLLLAVALLDSTIKVFFEDTLKFSLSLYGHKLPVMAMDISADSTLLVSASADKNVKVWGLDFGDLHKSFRAHADSVMAVGFVANTHYFVTASKDRTVRYWDADRFEQILALEGHKAEVWCLAVSPDGSFFATGSHDRSLRVWGRTEEQVFLEEEREKEMEAVLDRELRDPDGDAVLHSMDAVGPLGADGLAVVTDKDTDGPAPAAGGVGGKGAGMPEASSVVAHATRDTTRGADRLLEALALATAEADKWVEYAQDLAAARADAAKGLAGAAGKGGSGGAAAAAAAAAAEAEGNVTAPPRNQELLGLTPTAYVMRTLRSLRPSDVDQVLLTLPFSDAARLLKHLLHALRKGLAVELASRAALLLVRLHHAQISASPALLPVVLGLKEAMQGAVGAAKDRVGFNVAGLRHMDRALADVDVTPFFVGREEDAAKGAAARQQKKDAKDGGKGGGGGVRAGKRKDVALL